MVAELSRVQVNSWRLSRHHLAARAPKREMGQVVSDIGGLQAQVMSAAQIGLWARVEDITSKDVDDALWERRELVKTWSMRGTLHLHASADLPLYVAALKTRLGYKTNSWLKFHKITLDEIEKITSEVRNALDGRRLTREELVQEVVRRAKLRRWVRTEMLSGWGSLLHPAAFQGNLCFGPSQGKNVTFVRPDKWLGEWNEPSSEEALKTLVRRFIATYGPATHTDFAHWWGVEPNKARSIVTSLGSELEQVKFGGRIAWMRKHDVAQIRKTEPPGSVRLLPSFDSYIMFYHPRELFVSEKHRPLVFRQEAGWVSPVLLIDGLAAGVWTHKRKGSRLEVRVAPFKRLSPRHRTLVEDEARGLGAFLGFETEMSLSK
jgi:uncharacterized protein YcaQ